MNKNCKKCGAEFTPASSRQVYCCRRCNRGDPKKVVRWRRRLKLKAIEYKGGACHRCGYDKCPAALQFHHPNDNKEFSISHGGNTRAWEKVKIELDKCVLVCNNCHVEIHFDPDREL